MSADDDDMPGPTVPRRPLGAAAGCLLGLVVGALAWLAIALLGAALWVRFTTWSDLGAPLP